MSFGRLVASSVALMVPAAAVVAMTSTPAAAATRSSIVAVAERELADGQRNVERPAGSNCNYYTGVFRTWKSSSGCGTGDGVQFRESEWCADFSKFVWRAAGVTHADIAETSGGVLTGWAASFKDYGTKYGTWHTRSSGYTPLPGDAVVFDWDQSGDIDHVGIVTSANASTVTTIEGNSGDRVQANSYSRGNVDIVGYTAPVGITPDLPAEPEDATGEAADFDADGRVDLVGTLADGTLRAYLGTGTPGAPGVTGRPVEFGTGWTGITRISVADVDNDGKSDVLGRHTDGTLYAFLNSGTPGVPNIANRKTIGTGWNAITRVNVADIDNDGKTDVIGRSSDGTLYAYLNSGTPGAPNISTRVTIGTGWNSVTDVVTADLDNDGKVDVIGRSTDGTFYAYLNSGTPGTPNISNRKTIGSSWNGVSLISVVDIDNDGKTDVTARGGDGNLYAYLNKGTTGAPNISTKVLIGSSWNGINRLTIADIDHDGKKDVVGRMTDGDLYAYLNKGTTGAPNINTKILIGTGWSAITRLAVIN
ncbi:FG-GAP-like repeat-containing protein [Sphaerisporangium sp. TRM90804]|uniref:FG-GAP-like repeat-containing protein n=1 Tax=Sphaerisporangium sp. TRM90804 TaxID=3031113 RepID=UPI00244A16D0|nr:FG-GAP-like repeat-containing protein [Sphaerisporangium sp. TRM90804]MDH2426498.1 FG-GAP-like repeat-containing protein [Sphaerisporangium sp. TRM90804]